MPLNRTQNKLLLDNCSPQSAVFTWGGSNLLFDEASEAFLHGQDELSGEAPPNSTIYCAILGTILY